MRTRLPLLACGLLFGVATDLRSQRSSAPDTVIVPSGMLRLRGLLWRPVGTGPFPAILVMHGSGGRTFVGDPDRLGPLFARHGYVLLFVFRRGQGMSADQGANIVELLQRQEVDSGANAFNHLQVRLLETDHLDDGRASLDFLRSLTQVDAQRVGVIGHSFGGSIALLLAERDSSLRAAVSFGGAAASWERSPPLRTRLLVAVRESTVPTLFVYAANDFSVASGRELAAEMNRLGKVNRLKLYPAFGPSNADGHSIIYRAVHTWESDVFTFLDRYVRPSPELKTQFQSRSPAPTAARTAAHIAVIGDDYAFVQLPTTIAAGPTTFSFANRGRVRHEMSMVLLRPGVSPQQVLERGPNAAASRAIAERLIGILIARPGESSGGQLLVDLQSGQRYLVVCSLKDTPDAQPHVQLGMVTSFEVP